MATISTQAVEQVRLWSERGIVSSDLLLHAALGHYDETSLDVVRLLRFSDQLHVKTLEFQGGVWFDAGLAAFVRAQKSSGLSGTYRAWHGTSRHPIYTGFEMAIRCLSSAARFLITFEATKRIDRKDPAPGTFVSFITEEASPYHRMGWQGVEGRAEEVLRLCDVAIHGWGGAGAVQFGDHRPRDFRLSPNHDLSFAPRRQGPPAAGEGEGP